MTAVQQAFLKILRSSLHGEPVLAELTADQWAELLQLAAERRALLGYYDIVN